MTKRIRNLFIWISALAAFALQPHALAGKPGGTTTQTASFTNLPSLRFGGPSEALAVNEPGTVIVGYSWDRYDVLHAVKWTLQNGSWVITALPHGSASSAIARGVNNQGDVAGNNFPASTAKPVLWPATGGFVILGCDADVGPATVNAMTTAAQIAVGQQGGAGAVWKPSGCREVLPPIIAGTSSAARAVNGDGTIVGGAAAPDLSSSPAVPVRWMSINGQWYAEQLDSRAGTAHGANSGGDLAGVISTACALTSGCQRGVIWYAGGGSFEIGTLGGAHSRARDINSSREVVGMSTTSGGVDTAFFRSDALGMLQLPFKGSWAAANAVSDVRADGTRLVVGMSSQGVALVWVVRNR